MNDLSHNRNPVHREADDWDEQPEPQSDLLAWTIAIPVLLGLAAVVWAAWRWAA